MLGSTHFSPYIHDLSSAGGSGGMYPVAMLTASGRIVPSPFDIETVCSAGLRVHYLDFLLETDARRPKWCCSDSLSA